MSLPVLTFGNNYNLIAEFTHSDILGIYYNKINDTFFIDTVSSGFIPITDKYFCVLQYAIDTGDSISKSPIDTILNLLD